MTLTDQLAEIRTLIAEMKRLDYLRSQDLLTHWLDQQWLPSVSRALLWLARAGDSWLGRSNMKYITIRMDMRSGHFVLVDNQNHRADMELVSMLEEQLRRFA